MSEDNLTCYNCSDEITAGDEHVINEHNYCQDCVVCCEDCSEVVPSGDSVGEYCQDCGSWCDHCDSAMSSSDSFSVGNYTWCDSCYTNDTFYCETCDTSYDDNRVSSTSVDGTTYCEDCLTDECSYCDDCDEWYHDSTAHGCASAGNQRCRCRASMGDHIHDYSCKPELKFYGSDKPNALYMGFELETEIRGSIREAAAYADVELRDIAILKHDSSIGRGGSEGFEIVTMPTTHAYYQNNSDKLWQVIDKLRTEHNARSWDTETCGLHIHVSRNGFASGAHTHRFIAFIYKNAEYMMKFAGRKSTYARFNDVWRFDEYDRPYLSLKHKLDKHAPTERYSAVNTQNDSTLELRFFRGTMNPDGVMSALDLTQAIYDYTRNLRISDVNMGALKWEWFADYVRDNNGLYPSLYKRIDKVQAVNLNKKEQLNA